jgi:anthranilate synthase/aminodeoxychorismate synthase-like glutamine amidotransferase
VILVIDNYDSFTFNLVQYFGELGETLEVHRNDRLTLGDIDAMAPDAIVISPGPCTPREAGISVDVIRECGPRIPVLGVCLGHQAIGEAFGGRVVRASRVMHGKQSAIVHDGSGLFEGVPTPLRVMRYHSLVVERTSLPDTLEVTAYAADDPSEIHAMQHREFPVWGVQFHPESILTESGRDLLRNFLTLAEARRAVAR